MKKIYMPEGFATMVDDDIYEKWKDFGWKVSRDGYARRGKRINGVLTYFALHRVVLNCQKGDMVDHINGDRLDNRRENLRMVTWSQQARNRATRKDSTTGLKGVTPYKRNGVVKGYVASIYDEGRRIHLGLFSTAEYAHEAYVEAAKERYGEYMSVRPPMDLTGF